jgi:hypothetical protein
MQSVGTAACCSSPAPSAKSPALLALRVQRGLIWVRGLVPNDLDRIALQPLHCASLIWTEAWTIDHSGFIGFLFW